MSDLSLDPRTPAPDPDAAEVLEGMWITLNPTSELDEHYGMVGLHDPTEMVLCLPNANLSECGTQTQYRVHLCTLINYELAARVGKPTMPDEEAKSRADMLRLAARLCELGEMLKERVTGVPMSEWGTAAPWQAPAEKQA